MIDRRSLFKMAPTAAAAAVLKPEEPPPPQAVKLPKLEVGQFISIINIGDDKLLVYP
jgi:hypothetical protein